MAPFCQGFQRFTLNVHVHFPSGGKMVVLHQSLGPKNAGSSRRSQADDARRDRILGDPERSEPGEHRWGRLRSPSGSRGGRWERCSGEDAGNDAPDSHCASALGPGCPPRRYERAWRRSAGTWRQRWEGGACRPSGERVSGWLSRAWGAGRVGKREFRPRPTCRARCSPQPRSRA